MTQHNKQKHEEEPWEYITHNDWCGHIVNKESKSIIAAEVVESDAKRIVSCVNTMAGIENPEEFVEVFKEAVEALEWYGTEFLYDMEQFKTAAHLQDLDNPKNITVYDNPIHHDKGKKAREVLTRVKEVGIV